MPSVGTILHVNSEQGGGGSGSQPWLLEYIAHPSRSVGGATIGVGPCFQGLHELMELLDLR